MSARLLDALRGMVGLVQLVQHRYPDFPVDNHRVIEAQSAINEAEAVPSATAPTGDAWTDWLHKQKELEKHIEHIPYTEFPLGDGYGGGYYFKAEDVRALLAAAPAVAQEPAVEGQRVASMEATATHRHADGDLYQFVAESKYKTANDAEWSDAIIYRAMHNGMLFVTTPARWADRFIAISSAVNRGDGA